MQEHKMFVGDDDDDLTHSPVVRTTFSFVFLHELIRPSIINQKKETLW